MFSIEGIKFKLNLAIKKIELTNISVDFLCRHVIQAAACTSLGFQREAGPWNIGLEVSGTWLVFKAKDEGNTRLRVGREERTAVSKAKVFREGVWVLPKVQWRAECEDSRCATFHSH